MTLEAKITEILAIVDNESSQRLCQDLREWASGQDEADAMQWAEMLRTGIARWKEHTDRIRQLRMGMRTNQES